MLREPTTIDSPLHDEVGQGPSDSGRSLAPFDPWTEQWSPPQHRDLARKHALARKRERILARRGHGSTPIDLAALETAPETSSRTRLDRRPTWWGRMTVTVATVATAYWYYMLATIGLAIIVPLAIGWDTSTVATGSMEPVVAPGDVIAYADYQGDPLPVGSIIRFDDPVRAGETITHRVVATNPDGTYQTKGDANAHPDSTPVAPSSISGVARFVTPLAGLPQVWARSEEWTMLGTWILVTVGAGLAMHLAGAGPVPRARRRSVMRPALALGLVAALGGVGTAAWSSAAFAAQDGTGSIFESAITFPNDTPGESIGATTCSTGTVTTLTLAQPVAAGTTIIIRYSMRDRLTAAPLGATDSKGNAYSVDADAVNGTRAQASILSSSIGTTLIAGDQIVVTHPEGAATAVAFNLFGDIAGTNRVAATGTATGFGRMPSATIAVPDNDTLVIGVVAASHANATLTQPDGWTALDGGTANCGRKSLYGAGWLDPGPAGDVTYDPTLDKKARFAEVLVAYRTG